MADKAGVKSKFSDEWLSLRDAAQLMGVHPATLRSWADQGRIASRRTAGGHRRFSRSELQAWIDARRSHDAGAQVLIQNALGRMRVGLESTDAPWLSRFDEAMRRAHRELGRRLLQEVAHAASAPGLTDAVRSAADDIGREYAALSLGEVMPLVEAIRAFLFFRDNIVDSIIQMSGALEPIAAPSWLTMHRQICAFLNEVLFALVRAYGENRSG